MRLNPELEQLLLMLLYSIGGFTLGRVLGRSTRRQKVEQLASAGDKLEKKLAEQQRAAEDLWQRCHTAEASVEQLQLSIGQIPDIAERLVAARDLREIPERALDLVQELLEPAYSVFYRASEDELVAVACRGTSEFGVGHRLARGEGVVGWTAVRQVVFTPEDAQYESGVVKERNLSRCTPRQGFALATPVVQGGKTLGVMLIGRGEKANANDRELGRFVALLAGVAISSTVTTRKEQRLSRADGLTGLLNKTALTHKVKDTLHQDVGGPDVVSTILLDLDHLQAYNERNGVAHGDELLKAIGRLLRKRSREGEVAGRWDRAQFMLVLGNVPKATALKVAERIRSLIERARFPNREHQPGGHVSISAGVASWPEDAADFEGLVLAAESALQQAKRQRNVVVAHAAHPMAHSDDELELTDELEKPEA